MADRYEDARGVIQDLLVQPLDSVTEIFTVKGAVRGNHTHNDTVQWGYVVSGRLRIVHAIRAAPSRPWDKPTLNTLEYGPGEMFCDPPGIPHAWQAIDDCRVLVFTSGPRSGQNYESDTVRLTVPLLP